MPDRHFRDRDRRTLHARPHARTDARSERPAVARVRHDERTACRSTPARRRRLMCRLARRRHRLDPRRGVFAGNIIIVAQSTGESALSSALPPTGVSIVGLDGVSLSSVTIDGATNVTLRNLIIPDGVRSPVFGRHFGGEHDRRPDAQRRDRAARPQQRNRGRIDHGASGGAIRNTDRRPNVGLESPRPSPASSPTTRFPACRRP